MSRKNPKEQPTAEEQAHALDIVEQMVNDAASQPTAVDLARERVEAAEREQAEAQRASTDADAKRVAIESSPTENFDEWSAALESARRDADKARHRLIFTEKRLTDAREAFGPVERADLEDGVKNARLAARINASTMVTAINELIASVADPGRSILAVYRQLGESGDLAEADEQALLAKYSVRVTPLRVENPDLAELLRLAPADETPAALLRYAADVVEFLEAAPARAAERAERDRQRAEEVARRYRDECIAGHHGSEEQERAIKEVNAMARATLYPGGGAVFGMPKSDPELARYYGTKREQR